MQRTASIGPGDLKVVLFTMTVTGIKLCDRTSSPDDVELESRPKEDSNKQFTTDTFKTKDKHKPEPPETKTL
jgi:hypothetical protein